MSGILNVYVNRASADIGGTTILRGKITIPNEIVVETMSLKMYRYEFDTDAHAQTCNTLSFQTSWTRVGSINTGVDTTLTDATFAFEGLIIPLSSLLADTGYPQITFDVGRVITRTFDYSVTGFDLTGFTNLLLVFEYKLK